MARKRYAWASMIYGCSDCNKGCTMLLEEGIEGGFEPHKPAPFFIQCPFCGGHNFHHVNMHAEVFKSRRRIGPYEPFFANIKGDDCGCPLHMERARAQYTLSKQPSNVSENPLTQFAELLFESRSLQPQFRSASK